MLLFNCNCYVAAAKVATADPVAFETNKRTAKRKSKSILDFDVRKRGKKKEREGKGLLESEERGGKVRC